VEINMADMGRTERVELGSADTEETRLALVEIAEELTKGKVGNLEGMSRAESKLYRMQEKVLLTAKWKKMTEKVDFGKEVVPYKPVPIKLNGHLKAYNAWAMPDKIEFSKLYYKGASPKRLMRTLKHEMAHTFLMQNGVYDGHSALFKTCCHVLGLNSTIAMEATHNYQHICTVCGWWLKAKEKRHRISHICKGNLKDLVTKAEYQKLARIAKVGSKVVPVNIDFYQVMEVKKIGKNLKLKGADE
jgi:predicted SprT family Zn-dependent metalloprotease